MSIGTPDLNSSTRILHYPAMSSKEDNGLDSAAIERLHKLGGPVLVRRMLDIFLENAPVRMADARRGIDEDNLDAVERGVHSMRSSAGNVGATRLMELAEEAEDLAEQRTSEGLGDILTAVEEELSRVLDQLKTVLEGIEE